MKEYFAASRMDIGRWGNPQWYDDYTASLSLGTLTDEEAATLRLTVEGEFPDENRAVYIVPDDCIRAKILSATFFEKVHRHLEEARKNMLLDRPVDSSDFPPYFLPIKEAYLAACVIQKPQRLPDFDSLFSLTSGPASVVLANQEPSTDAVYIVDAIRRLPGYQELRPTEPPDESKGRWVSLEKAIEIRGVKKETLADYRTRGQHAADRLSGIDSQGFYWRREKGNLATEYFIPNASDRRQ